MTLHEMAVRLCEGGSVYYGGYFIKAKVVDEETDPCIKCRMDCVCHYDMATLCHECDEYNRKKHILMFANDDDNC